MNWLGIGGFSIALIGLLITIIKMWMSFQNGFEQHKTEVKLKLQEYEMKTNALILDMKDFKEAHDQDIQQLTTRFQSGLDLIHKENREDHGKLFNILDGVGKMLTKVDTSLTMHLKNEGK